MNDYKLSIKASCDEQIRFSLIEEAFNYPKQHSFAIDFYPLFSREFDNGYDVAYIDNELVAHIGYCKRKLVIKNEEYKIAFIGAISVAKKFQGKGIFKQLFTHTLSHLKKDHHLMMLWSGDAPLYEKFGFSECGSIYQLGENNFENPSINPSLLTDDDLEQMNNLYQKSWPNRIIRDDHHWKELKKMTSVKIHLELKQEEIVSYSIFNKGFDLSGVVHEFAAIDMNEYLNKYSHYKVWSPKKPSQFQGNKFWLGLACEGDLWGHTQSVAEFINSNEIMIGGIDSI